MSDDLYLSSPAAGVRSDRASAQLSLSWLWIALLLVCLAPLQAISAQFVNRAEFHTSEIPTLVSTVAVTKLVSTPATIEFLQYAPKETGAPVYMVPATYYQTGNSPTDSFALLPPPVQSGSLEPINLSGPLPLLPVIMTHSGEPLFVKVTDLDQNFDPTVAETIISTITNSLTGDIEIIRLTESAPDSGIFIGYIQTTPMPGLYNGTIAVTSDSVTTASYKDKYDDYDVITDTVLIDPYGLVFDSMSGKPINGAIVELLNADGSPAAVYGDSGLPANTFPNKVISGGTANDAEGNVYSFPPGGYRFPFVNSGNYILKITPPAGYSAPSTVSTQDIQVLPGSPFAIKQGSRGEVFPVPIGPALRIDIPLDPQSVSLWLRKSADRNIVSAGEYLGYELNLDNNDPHGAIYTPVITDRLPHGFRYIKGSAKINGRDAVDPSVSSDGRTLQFKLADIPSASSLKIRYVVAVGAGVNTGAAENTALATTASRQSNRASATVQVLEPFMRTRSTLMGRVFVGACSENPTENMKGMEGIALYLEDGTFVISDAFGMFHFDGVQPGVHVVQLDAASVPPGYQVLQCEENSRFAGRSYSQFVDLQGGTMWRTDFYLGKTEPAPVQPTQPPVHEPSADRKGEITLEMLSSQNDAVIDYRISLKSHTVLLSNQTLRVALPDVAAYIPGSSKFNGTALPDPEIRGASLVYPLENTDVNWTRELQFSARIDKRTIITGELETSAVLTFDTTSERAISTPLAINTLVITRREKFLPLPLFVFHPHFETFSAELKERDKKELDGLLRKLSGKIIERLEISGHTDNVRIAPRSRSIFADNTELSLARAKSVASYLAPALLLPPAALHIAGSGDTVPLAANSTAKGRALNRRVEVNVTALDKTEEYTLQISRERSGPKTRETFAGVGNISTAEPEAFVAQRLSTDPMNIPAADRDSRLIVADTTVVPAAQESNPAAPAPQTTKIAPPAPKSSEESVELISALNDGLINYRIKLTNFKKSPKNITVTLVTPQSFLFMNESSRLSGATIPDPQIDGSVLTYHFDNLPEDKRFDLRLQAIIDGNDQTESLGSSVTAVVTADDGTPFKTMTAATELTDNMDEFNRIDIPQSAIIAAAVQFEQDKDESGLYQEKVTSLPKAAASAPEQETEQHISEDSGILSLTEGSIIATRINSVRIVLDSTLTPTLLLDGLAIPHERIGFSMADKKSGKTLYTFIGVDFGEAGQHTLQLKGLDSFGQSRFDKTVKYVRSGDIVSLKLLTVDGNVADGRSPVRVRIQLFDANNNLIATNTELTLKNSDLRPLTVSGTIDKVATSGAVAVDVDGWMNFQPVTNSGLYRAQLAYNTAVLDIETYVQPKMRDWILVGLAEGTVGYNTISGNMENLKSSDQKEDLYNSERLALYAKGTVKGEWLLTMAYDSAKKSTGVSGQNALFQTIDPNSIYTIYADGSAQMYDAASQKKLYLKIERDQFYALFGDYNTGLTVTELSRYNRSMTGLKSEYRSRDFDVTAFGSETGQSFVKDEIRGDGTSGLYRLSRKGIVINSEKITLESRDRFHSEVITDSRQLNRFIDYSIDYETGAIFFKSPVASKDDKFNPVYIVVDYEILNAGKESLTYGGRAATRILNGRMEVGGTYVREGQDNGDNTLYGADATAILAPGTKARIEFATTDNKSGPNLSGNYNYLSSTDSNAQARQQANAYLAEVVHTGKNLDGRLYYREREEGFGLSQQSGSEAGTRKLGVESSYRLNQRVTLNGQTYRQYNLADDGVRDFIESLALYSEKQYTVQSGLRYANDTLPDGNNETSVLATAGGSWRTANQNLTLRATHDQSLYNKNENTDFPTRTIFGVDYHVTKATTIFAEEELTYGDAANTNTTRVGVKSTPWSGGTINSAVVNDQRENSDRTFANVGLTQRWQMNQRWAVDGGIDHSEMIREKSGYMMNSNVPPASGGDNFTAVSLGANYTQKKMTWSNRAEYRNSDTDDKWGLISGIVNEHGLDWAWTGRVQIYHTQSVGGNSSTTGDLRLGLVYRPPVTKWIVLNRLDLIGSDMKSETDTVKGRRIVNNLNANWKPDKKTQLSFQYGAKYVLEKIDDKEYSGYTDLMGFEGRYDINKEWDLCMRSSLLHTWESDQYAYSFGPSIGYNVMENAWLSVGYNVAGFTDKDFSNANYTAQGPYIQYRFKFDQNSVKDGLKALNQ